MDISSLLSPGPDSPGSSRPGSRSSPRSSSASAGPPNGHTQRPTTHPRKSSGLSQQVTYGTTPPRSFTLDDHHHAVRPTIKPHSASSPALGSSYRYAHAENRAAPSSLGGMDALAEVASRQRPQTIVRQHNETSSNSSIITHGSTRSVVDAAMPDAPPTAESYKFDSLPSEVATELSHWAKRVQDNPFDVTSHTTLVQKLHAEFCNHVESGRDAHSFGPVQALRQARSAMDKIFPVGEELWVGWLTDENLLSRTIDDRINVMDLHHRSILDEPSSAALWRNYGDYMYFLWSASNSNEGGWSEEDRTIGQEVFKWDSMVDVWEQGIDRTQWHLNDSNLVWDRYIEILIGDLDRTPSPQKITNIKEKFIERLTAKAHATFEQTAQAFSQFLSQYDAKAYESTMASVSQRSGQIKKLLALRDPYEFKVQQASDRCDKDAEWTAYNEYLAWELKTKGVFSTDLINGLYERATTRFPTDAGLWNDYVEFLIENPVREIPTLSVLERATRHCPWSGELWSHRLLAMESENKAFEEIEEVKHKATASGLVDANSMEDLMKVYIAWCGYLRRRAFKPGSTEEEIDMAEMGIRSSIEDGLKAGEKRYGSDYTGDPSYRLERIHIKLLYQRNDYAGCTALWEDMTNRVGDSYDFWYRYYIYSMITWGKATLNVNPIAAPTPNQATKVLEMALARVETLDWPEQLLPMYLNHCEQHETVQVYRQALITVRRATKKIAERRERERLAYEEHTATRAVSTSEPIKRKRDDDSVVEDVQPKKLKADAPQDAMEVDQSHAPVEPEQPKRDRENTTILVHNLPEGTTEIRVRQFFRDCGTVNDIHIHGTTGSLTAMVEFETKDDALYAQTRVNKPFDGNSISIEFSTGSTLWVTNYPPTADDKYIRSLFEKYGEISEVRFPSLQGNTHRRFCYVQFLSPVSAQKATELDGQLIDGKYHLKAKVSDPSIKQGRQGALYEGREIFVRNVNYRSTESEVKDHFSSCGTVEKARIPTNINGQGTGVAFIVFELKESAQKAVETMNNTPYKNRTLHVEMSVPKGKRTETTILRRSTATPDAESLPDAGSANGDAAESDIRSVHQRTFAILGLPDTVNVARLEKLIEPYGGIKKISLRPDHGGAFVEMAELNTVGKAMLALDGLEIDGKTVYTGSRGELFKQRAEKKASNIAERLKETKSIGSGFVSRPGQAAKRGGRAGNLGKKTGIGFRKPDGHKADEGGAKSNDDFRKMFLKGNQTNGEEQAD